MHKSLIVLAVFAAPITSVRAETFAEMAQFAQSICGDIPEGSLTRTTIQGKVQANAGLLAKIVSGSADVSGSKAEEIYKGIPFDKLPDNIPTVSMCKSELVKILLQRKKQVFNKCRLPEFGQEGWNRTEEYPELIGMDGWRSRSELVVQSGCRFIYSKQDYWSPKSHGACCLTRRK